MNEAVLLPVNWEKWKKKQTNNKKNTETTQNAQELAGINIRKLWQ